MEDNLALQTHSIEENRPRLVHLLTLPRLFPGLLARLRYLLVRLPIGSLAALLAACFQAHLLTSLLAFHFVVCLLTNKNFPTLRHKNTQKIKFSLTDPHIFSAQFVATKR